VYSDFLYQISTQILKTRSEAAQQIEGHATDIEVLRGYLLTGVGISGGKFPWSGYCKGNCPCRAVKT
jgi:hypothetical protein